MSTPHLIERIEFEIEFDPPDAELQDERNLARLLQDTLLPVVDEVLDAWDEPGTVLSLPSLSIDLGVIECTALREQAPARLRALLEEALAAARYRSKRAPGDAYLLEDGAAPSHRTAQDDALAQLSAYLASGRMAWHHDLTRSDVQVALLDSLLGGDRAALVRMLAQSIARPQALRRLSEQFPARQLAAIVRAAAPRHATGLLAVQAEWHHGRRVGEPRWQLVLGLALGGHDTAVVLSALGSMMALPASPSIAGLSSMQIDGLVAWWRRGERDPGQAAVLERLLDGDRTDSLRQALAAALAVPNGARRLVAAVPASLREKLLRVAAPACAARMLSLIGEIERVLIARIADRTVAAEVHAQCWEEVLTASLQRVALAPSTNVLRARLLALMAENGRLGQRHLAIEVPTAVTGWHDECLLLAEFLDSGPFKNRPGSHDHHVVLLDRLLIRVETNADAADALRDLLRTVLSRPASLRRLTTQFPQRQLIAINRALSLQRWESPIGAGGRDRQIEARTLRANADAANLQRISDQAGARGDGAKAGAASDVGLEQLSQSMPSLDADQLPMQVSPPRQRASAEAPDELTLLRTFAAATMPAEFAQPSESKRRPSASDARRAAWRKALATGLARYTFPQSGAGKPNSRDGVPPTRPAFVPGHVSSMSTSTYATGLTGATLVDDARATLLRPLAERFRQRGLAAAVADTLHPRPVGLQPLHRLIDQFPQPDFAPVASDTSKARLSQSPNELARLSEYLVTGRLPIQPEANVGGDHIDLLDRLLERADRIPSLLQALLRMLATVLTRPHALRRLTEQFPQRQLLSVLYAAAPAHTASFLALFAEIQGERALSKSASTDHELAAWRKALQLALSGRIVGKTGAWMEDTPANLRRATSSGLATPGKAEGGSAARAAIARAFKRALAVPDGALRLAVSMHERRRELLVWSAEPAVAGEVFALLHEVGAHKSGVELACWAEVFEACLAPDPISVDLLRARLRELTTAGQPAHPPADADRTAERIELLAAFLRNERHTPAQTDVQREDHVTLLDALLDGAEPPRDLWRMLASILEHAPAARHLVEQFPERQLRDIVAKAAPAHFPELFALVAELHRDSATTGIAPRHMRQAFWPALLRAVVRYAAGLAPLPGQDELRERVFVLLPASAPASDHPVMRAFTGRRRPPLPWRRAEPEARGREMPDSSTSESWLGRIGQQLYTGARIIPARGQAMPEAVAGDGSAQRIDFARAFKRALAAPDGALRLARSMQERRRELLVWSAAPEVAVEVLALLHEVGAHKSEVELACWAEVFEACLAPDPISVGLLRARLRELTTAVQAAHLPADAHKHTERIELLAAFLRNERHPAAQIDVQRDDHVILLDALLDGAELPRDLWRMLASILEHGPAAQRLVEQFPERQLRDIVARAAPAYCTELCALVTALYRDGAVSGIAPRPLRLAIWPALLRTVVCYAAGLAPRPGQDELRERAFALMLASAPEVPDSSTSEGWPGQIGQQPDTEARIVPAGRQAMIETVAGDGSAQRIAFARAFKRALATPDGALRLAGSMQERKRELLVWSAGPAVAVEVLALLHEVGAHKSEVELACWGEVFEACLAPGPVSVGVLRARLRGIITAAQPARLPADADRKAGRIELLAAFLRNERYPAAQIDVQRDDHVTLLDALLCGAESPRDLWHMLASSLEHAPAALRLVEQFPERQLRDIVAQAAPAHSTELFALVAALHRDGVATGIAPRPLRLAIWPALLRAVVLYAADLAPLPAQEELRARVFALLPASAPASDHPVMRAVTGRRTPPLPWRRSGPEAWGREVPDSGTSEGWVVRIRQQLDTDARVAPARRQAMIEAIAGAASASGREQEYMRLAMNALVRGESLDLDAIAGAVQAQGAAVDRVSEWPALLAGRRADLIRLLRRSARHPAIREALADCLPPSMLVSMDQAARPDISAAVPATRRQGLADAPNHPGAQPGERIALNNAGMVLMAPYVARLFAMLGLVQEGEFVDLDAAERAVHLLQFAVSGETDAPEYRLTLNKLLCGLPLDAPVPAGIDITPEERSTIEGLLEAMIASWSALGRTSIDGLRQSFLMREGELELGPELWQLAVAQGPFDMLMDRLPWSFSIVKFAWMPLPLHVTWH